MSNGTACKDLSDHIKRGPDSSDIFKLIYSAKFFALSFQCGLEREGVDFGKMGVTEDVLRNEIEKLKKFSYNLEDVYAGYEGSLKKMVEENALEDFAAIERAELFSVKEECYLFEKLLKEQLEKIESLFKKINIVSKKVEFSTQEVGSLDTKMVIDKKRVGGLACRMYNVLRAEGPEAWDFTGIVHRTKLFALQEACAFEKKVLD